MNKIPIVISSDNKIFFTVSVVLTSLLENAKDDTFYEINVLYTEDVTQDNLDKLQKLKEKYKNISLNTFNMGNKFKDIPTTKGYHVNYVSAYKMLIPSMFQQYDKVIYLDTDILVRGDLQELYNFDIGDNYIASTPVLANIIYKEEELSKMLDIPDCDYYVNAGVMLMNLKKIREDKIDEQWISLLGSFEGSVDQHILNKTCYGRTSYLPLKFNVCMSNINLYKNERNYSYYCLKEIQEAVDNPTIFHWTGKQKPWKYKDIFLAQEWNKYFLKSPSTVPLKRINSTMPKSQPIEEKRHYLLGIPVLKTVKIQNKVRLYLFNFIRIYGIRSRILSGQ